MKIDLCVQNMRFSICCYIFVCLFDIFFPLSHLSFCNNNLYIVPFLNFLLDDCFLWEFSFFCLKMITALNISESIEFYQILYNSLSFLLFFFSNSLALQLLASMKRITRNFPSFQLINSKHLICLYTVLDSISYGAFLEENSDFSILPNDNVI